MSQSKAYLNSATHPVVAIVAGVDKDVERGEDILMLGYSLVLMAPIFAPIAPPRVLLPLMALAFVISVCVARLNFLGIRTKLAAAMAALDGRQDLSLLKPITEIFAEHPKSTLTEGFNPLKNWQRTAKSILGAMMINSFWMPIFYMLGLQFVEEKQLSLLNRAVMEAEEKTSSWR
ncbi:hypothetical protein A1359_04610 [Methylomonas lenta]|uniref:Uncharacterized protein n=1 Tax=Methylomonas lenta TaxID=980561 RepID=A0A177NMP5_9GAMM|nr:hypothetical protein [Methylomonas lenta]OAI18643.1 hypothetical protein A1359_04610 [Methylomonas lenta]